MRFVLCIVRGAFLYYLLLDEQVSIVRAKCNIVKTCIIQYYALQEDHFKPFLQVEK